MNRKNHYIKSSFCGIGACIEVKRCANSIFIRKSGNPKKILRFSRKEWETFKKGIKNDEF